MLALIPFALANWRALVIAGAAIAIVVAGLTYRHELIVEGENDALQKVNNANAQAQSAAQAAAQNVDDCFNAGGTWDRDRGVCNAAPAGK